MKRNISVESEKIRFAGHYDSDGESHTNFLIIEEGKKTILLGLDDVVNLIEVIDTLRLWNDGAIG